MGSSGTGPTVSNHQSLNEVLKGSTLRTEGLTEGSLRAVRAVTSLFGRIYATFGLRARFDCSGTCCIFLQKFTFEILGPHSRSLSRLSKELYRLLWPWEQERLAFRASTPNIGFAEHRLRLSVQQRHRPWSRLHRPPATVFRLRKTDTTRALPSSGNPTVLWRQETPRLT